VTPLARAFYDRPTDSVARALLGHVLVCGGRAGRIVETEAYLGPQDAASHARFGRTTRNDVMFGPTGVSYVYMIYGMYDMFNVVARRGAAAGAVLIRAVSPLAGLPRDPACCRGPGKLTRALGISRQHHARDLTRASELFIARGRRAGAVASGARIGVDYAGAWARRPLRYWIEGHPAVSRPR